MGSEMWGKQFGRSPRQDRRVVINGKFYELAPVQNPEPVEEEKNTALEIVQVSKTEETNAANEGTSAGADVPTDGVEETNGSLSQTARKTDSGNRRGSDGVVAGIPNVVPAVETLSEKLQSELEPLPAALPEPKVHIGVLSPVGKDANGSDVLDGEIGRTEPHITLADEVKAGVATSYNELVSRVLDEEARVAANEAIEMMSEGGPVEVKAEDFFAGPPKPSTVVTEKDIDPEYTASDALADTLRNGDLPYDQGGALDDGKIE